MFKFVRSRSLSAALVCLFSAAGAFFPVAGAHAQSTTATPMDRQLSRMDLALSGIFDLTSNSSGGNSIGPVSQNVSESSGGLFTLRYTKSPWLGAEMNYKFSRMTQNFIYSAVSQNPGGGTTVTPALLGVQTNVSELSWGYIAHTPGTYFGLSPFGGIGLGTIEFKPTPAGGEGLLRQFRATYYWNIGADYTIPGSHFGARVQLRQLFYLAPDFEQSYLVSGARTNTLEPTIGFFAHF